MVDGKYVDGLTTTYRITSAIVSKLKSLFGFLAQNVIQKATQTLELFSKDDFSCLAISNKSNSNHSKGKVRYHLANRYVNYMKKGRKILS